MINKKNRRQMELRRRALLKDKKRRIKNKKRKYMLYYIFFAMIIISTTMILSFNVFFKIEEMNVSVSGKDITAEEILDKINLKCNDSLLLVDSKKYIDKLLSHFPTLGNAEIKKHFPNKLDLNCIFNDLKFLVETPNNQFLGISSSGRVIKNYAEMPIFDENIPIIKISTKTFTTPKLGAFLTLPEQEKQTLLKIAATSTKAHLNNITKIEINSNFTVTITYDDRINIEINNISKLEQILTTASKIILDYTGIHEKGTICFFENDQTLHFIPTYEQSW